MQLRALRRLDRNVAGRVVPVPREEEEETPAAATAAVPGPPTETPVPSDAAVRETREALGTAKRDAGEQVPWRESEEDEEEEEPRQPLSQERDTPPRACDFPPSCPPLIRPLSRPGLVTEWKSIARSKNDYSNNNSYDARWYSLLKNLTR